jgi:hypothetical protein
MYIGSNSISSTNKTQHVEYFIEIKGTLKLWKQRLNSKPRLWYHEENKIEEIMHKINVTWFDNIFTST